MLRLLHITLTEQMYESLNRHNTLMRITLLLNVEDDCTSWRIFHAFANTLQFAQSLPNLQLSHYLSRITTICFSCLALFTSAPLGTDRVKEGQMSQSRLCDSPAKRDVADGEPSKKVNKKAFPKPVLCCTKRVRNARDVPVTMPSGPNIPLTNQPERETCFCLKWCKSLLPAPYFLFCWLGKGVVWWNSPPNRNWQPSSTNPYWKGGPDPVSGPHGSAAAAVVVASQCHHSVVSICCQVEVGVAAVVVVCW